MWFTSKPYRHFFGHGVFSADGKLLYTTENDYQNARGMIGVRDATDGYKQIVDLATGDLLEEQKLERRCTRSPSGTSHSPPATRWCSAASIAGRKLTRRRFSAFIAASRSR